MRKSQKADLYKNFITIKRRSPDLEKDFIYVIDGGWLLHKYVWQSNKTFQQIFEGYRNFIVYRFGQNATVVFDGYASEIIGTKSYERYLIYSSIYCTSIKLCNILIVYLIFFIKGTGARKKR